MKNSRQKRILHTPLLILMGRVVWPFGQVVFYMIPLAVLVEVIVFLEVAIQGQDVSN